MLKSIKINKIGRCANILMVVQIQYRRKLYLEGTTSVFPEQPTKNDVQGNLVIQRADWPQKLVLLVQLPYRRQDRLNKITNNCPKDIRALMAQMTFWIILQGECDKSAQISRKQFQVARSVTANRKYSVATMLRLMTARELLL